jgi:hypothetical protein
VYQQQQEPSPGVTGATRLPTMAARTAAATRSPKGPKVRTYSLLVLGRCCCEAYGVGLCANPVRPHRQTTTVRYHFSSCGHWYGAMMTYLACWSGSPRRWKRRSALGLSPWPRGRAWWRSSTTGPLPSRTSHPRTAGSR